MLELILTEKQIGLNTSTCTSTCMTIKNLTITEDAYEMLKQRKVMGESFSEVIRRLVKEKGDPTKYYGALKELMTDEEAEALKRDIEDDDLKSTKRLDRELK